MVVKTYKEITRFHGVRHGMYYIFIIIDRTKNSNKTYDLFRYSGRFTLQQVINYMDTFKYTDYQYELY